MTDSAMPHLVKRASDRLYAEMTGQRVLFALFLYIILTATLQLINTKMKTYPGIGLLSFETFYDAARAHQSLTTFGAEGRQVQLIVVLIDLFLYVPIYTLLFSFIITYFLTKTRYKGPFKISNLFPFLVAVINVLKDVCILSLLAAYPARMTIVGTGAGFLILTEWILSSITLCLILFSLLMYLWRGIRMR